MKNANGNLRGRAAPAISGWRSGLVAHGNLVRGSTWLTATVVASAISGFSFWLLAARTYAEGPVGRAAAAFTAVLFVNYLTTLGLPIAVGRYAADRSRTSGVLFGWALLVTTLSAGVGTALFWLVAGREIVEPLDRLGSVLGPIVFFVAVAGISVALLVDVRLTALRRWEWVLARVAIIGVIRLPLISWGPISETDLWLFLLVAVLPAVASLLMAAALAVRGRARLGRMPPSARLAARFAVVNFASLLALQAPQFILPLLVALSVNAGSYSAFYIAFQIATVAFLVPQVLAQVLLVEGGRESSDLDAQVRVAMIATICLMTVVAVGGFAFAWVLPILYGENYGEAARLLPLLLGAGVAWAVTSIVVTKARILEVERVTIGIAAGLAVAIVVPAAFFTAWWGAEGAAAAWLGGHIVIAGLAAASGSRLRRVAGTRPIPPAPDLEEALGAKVLWAVPARPGRSFHVYVEADRAERGEP